MVDGVLIVEHLKGYKAHSWELYFDMDVVSKGALHFDGKRPCFDLKEDDLLDDEEEIHMVDIRTNTTSTWSIEGEG